MKSNPFPIAYSDLLNQISDSYLAFSISFMLLLVFAANICFLFLFWKEYQSRQRSIQKEIRKHELSLKIEYQQLKNLFPETHADTDLNNEIDSLMKETFGSHI